jgi:uncharacterized protein (TIGR03083 family)
MPEEIAELYAEARGRVVAFVATLDEDELARSVPGCPGWTVADTLAHLVSIPEDALAGRLAGPPSDEQSAAQVERWRGRPVAELLESWRATAPVIDPIVAAAGASIAPIAIDVHAHELDLLGALGRTGGRDTRGVRWMARVLVDAFAERCATRRDSEVPAFDLVVSGHVTRIGSGSGEGRLVLDAFEVARSMLGRRSRAQVEAWPWPAGTIGLLDSWFVFGPRAEPLVE